MIAGHYKNEEGFWLKSGKLEAFVTAEPHVRVKALRLPGGHNVLVSDGPEPTGLRTWIMNPSESLEFRDEVSGLPALNTTLSKNTLSLKTGTSEKLGLELGWDLSFSDSEDQLILRHTLTNNSDVPQELSAWSIAVVPEETRIRVPLDSPFRSENPHFPYQLYVFPYSNLKDPRMSLNGNNELEVDVVSAPGERPLKIGVVSKSGTLIAEEKDYSLSSSVEYDPAGTYPEGGANLTVFALGKETHCFAELEHMSPLQTVQTGSSISLVQHLSIDAENK